MTTNKYKDWSTFVRMKREEISRLAPSVPTPSPKVEELPTWSEFVKSLRFKIEHDDQVLLNAINAKDTTISELTTQLADANATIEELKSQLESATKSATKEQPDLSQVFLDQIAKAQKFIENSKCNGSEFISFISLLKKIVPQQYHDKIDEIRANGSGNVSIKGDGNIVATEARSLDIYK